MSDFGIKSAMLGAAGRAVPTIPFHAEIAAELTDAVARAAGRLLGNIINIEPQRTDIITKSDLIDALDPQSLSLTLMARGTQPIGMLTATPALVSQLALRMSGAAHSAGNPRQMSKVDQSLAQMLIQRALENLQTGLAIRGAKIEAESLRIGTSAVTGAALQANLPQGNHVRFTLRFPLDENSEDCLITFYFHFDFCTALDTIRSEDSYKTDGADNLRWQAHMQKVALASPIEARCILERFELRAGEVDRLREGDVLPLTGHGLSDIALEMAHITGTLTYARGKLGAYRRSKALKIRTKLENDGNSPTLAILDRGAEFSAN